MQIDCFDFVVVVRLVSLLLQKVLYHRDIVIEFLKELFDLKAGLVRELDDKKSDIVI